MGSDIHCYIEVKSGVIWENATPSAIYAALDVITSPDRMAELHAMGVPKYSIRNYTLFAQLANVRNYQGVEPIDKPRGLPDDASEEVKDSFLSWGSDAHSASWLTLHELKKYYDSGHGQRYKDMAGEFVTYTMPYMATLAEDPKDVRIVFWFDN